MTAGRVAMLGEVLLLVLPASFLFFLGAPDTVLRFSDCGITYTVVRVTIVLAAGCGIVAAWVLCLSYVQKGSESFVAARTPLWAMAFAGAAVALMSFLVGLLPKPEEYSCRAFLYSDIAGMRLGVILLVPLAHLIAAKSLAQRGNTRKQEPHHSRA